MVVGKSARGFYSEVLTSMNSNKKIAKKFTDRERLIYMIIGTAAQLLAETGHDIPIGNEGDPISSKQAEKIIKAMPKENP